VFPPGANWLVKWSMAGGAVLLLLVGTVAPALYWGPMSTRLHVTRPQPIPFSHERHVAGNGIDCRYCHTTVETGAFAGIPPTETCMTCHSQVYVDQAMLQPVRDSWSTGKPLEWVRVNDLPDFVYFDHSIHISRGVSCVTCHGRVDEMRLTRKEQTLRMGWCLNCHKNPEKFIRPHDKVFDMGWSWADVAAANSSENTSHEESAASDHATPSPSHSLSPREQGLALVQENKIEVDQLMNCSICHR